MILYQMTNPKIYVLNREGVVRSIKGFNHPCDQSTIDKIKNILITKEEKTVNFYLILE